MQYINILTESSLYKVRFTFIVNENLYCIFYIVHVIYTILYKFVTYIYCIIFIILFYYFYYFLFLLYKYSTCPKIPEQERNETGDAVT